MNKAKENRGNKKPVSKDDILDEIVPKRAVDKVIKNLKVLKSKHDLKTRGVISTNFGFAQRLTMFVLPELTDVEIIAKFTLRLNHEPVSNLLRLKV